LHGIASTLPAALVALVLGCLPFLVLVILSFTNFSFSLPDRSGRWVGFDNYERILSDSELGAAVLRTGLFAAIAVSIEAMLGTALAFCVWLRGGRAKLCVLFLVLPCLLAPVTAGLLGRLLFHGDYGPIAYALQRIGALPGGTILGDTTLAFTALLLLDCWQWTPLVFLMVLVALHSIPQGLILSARIDGASTGRILRSIVLPIIAPTIGLAAVIRFLDAMREFEKVFYLTGGGPASSTEVLAVYSHRIAFDHGNVAYAAAIAVVGLLGTLVLTRLLLTSARRILL
jgi:multiple sugar transport system permease protein